MIRNKRSFQFTLLAVVSVLVCVHVLWNIIAVLFLPWALAALVVMWLGGIGRVFFRRWRRW